MKLSKIISVFYIIISVISYGILAIVLVVPPILVGMFIRISPLTVIFCIWLVMTIIKLIKKSFISFSEGKIAQGIGLLLAGIALPGIIFLIHIYGILLF